MKKTLLATVAVIALGATVPALAADLGAAPRTYTKAPAYVQPIYNWTGFYIGGHVGGAFSGSHSLRGDLVHILHGGALADPYRWLEAGESAETRQWVAAQNALTRSVLDALPER